MVKEITVSKDAAVILCFDIDLKFEVMQEIAMNFGRESGLPVMVVDKHVEVTILNKGGQQ